MHELNGLRAARELYSKLVNIPPIQIEVHKAMIQIEKEQPKPNIREIQRCFEWAIATHGAVDVDLWDEYIDFETTRGNNTAVDFIHRRAMAKLPPALANIFQTRQCDKRIVSQNANAACIPQRHRPDQMIAVVAAFVEDLFEGRA